MRAFRYQRVETLDDAGAPSAAEGAVVKGGGTDLLDRMKERITTPDLVLDVSRAGIDDGRWRTMSFGTDGAELGALVTLAEILNVRELWRYLPALGRAIGEAASPQVRHRATLAGNLLQHTRCGYYRHGSFPCLKRGDATCPVLEDGAVQEHAGIFGNRPCASAHPSSIAPVLLAHGTTVTILSGKTTRQMPLEDLYRAPERGRESDHTLAPGELLAVVTVHGSPKAEVAYEEARQRAAFDWPMASCAVRIDPEKDAAGAWFVAGARVALGSVAPTPIRSTAAEEALAGKPLTDAVAAAAGRAARSGATPLAGNAHKVELVETLVRRAVSQAFGRIR